MLWCCFPHLDKLWGRKMLVNLMLNMTVSLICVSVMCFLLLLCFGIILIQIDIAAKLLGFHCKLFTLQ